MIPGKVFFESISVSQQLSNNYSIYLLLNGIFYDKIKLFQTKYLCLTANDVLQVELALKKCIPQQENQSPQQTHSKHIKHTQQTNEKTTQQSYLKISIPHTYKLLIQSKTVDIKFQLNKKNKYQEIKVNLAFEPVTSFNRKKLGATIVSAKNATQNFNNKFTHFNNSPQSQKNYEFYEGDSLVSYNQAFPQELNFSRNRNGPASPLSETLKPTYNFFENNSIHNQHNLKQRNPTQTIPMQKSQERKKESNQHDLKADLNINPSHYQQNANNFQQLNQTTKTQVFSDLFQKQVLTSRTYNPNAKEKIKISQQINENFQNDNQLIEHNYPNLGNYKSSEMPSEMDTLQSLAYQREKILGQLFGKFSHRNKK